MAKTGTDFCEDFTAGGSTRLINILKVKVNTNIHQNILSEIMRLLENGGCGRNL